MVASSLDYSLRLQPSVAGSLVVEGSATFAASHPAFDGHFPGFPILPAFLHVQVALDLLTAAGLPADLLRVESAKFIRPILPAQEIILQMTHTAACEYDVAVSVDG